MIVGVPKETKRDEYRVAMLPVGVEELTRAGHQVLFEPGAGVGSGILDERYVENGATLSLRIGAYHLKTASVSSRMGSKSISGRTSITRP